MIIAGGSYLEICLRPQWRRLFGSGLRAACAVSHLSPGTKLYTYGFDDWAGDIEHTAAAFGCSAVVTRIKDPISFSYNHPLASAHQDPAVVVQNIPLKIEGPAVLRFGFVEGDAIVHADRAIYDPQSCGPAEPFAANGSRANQLALVLNEDEADFPISASDVDVLMNRHEAEVAVIKRGPRGATIHARGQDTISVPPYHANTIFKIGSGDVFSAAFALYWGERNLDAATAADLASRSVSSFVDGHSLPLPAETALATLAPANSSSIGKIYLAGPFFDVAQRWLIEEIYETLARLGADVFSPLHEVGIGLPVEEIAEADLKGLRDCSKVLALLDGGDPGTLFEVGYARALGIPVVALAERVTSENLTMYSGSGCHVVTDLTTAIYRVIWTPGR